MPVLRTPTRLLLAPCLAVVLAMLPVSGRGGPSEGGHHERADAPAAGAQLGFDHALTGFSLEPAHSAASCDVCHGSPFTSAGLVGECAACHESTRPGGHYQGACDGCHTGAHWSPAGLGEHPHAITGFALDGAHARLECAECHPPGRPRGLTSPSCIGCHATDDHHQHQLGDACGDCHQPTTWLHTSWSHHRTGFPLRGPHRLAPCIDCHATGYVGTPRDCWRCHEAEAPADVPAHSSAAFSQCDRCHKPYTWLMPGFPN